MQAKTKVFLVDLVYILEGEKRKVIELTKMKKLASSSNSLSSEAIVLKLVMKHTFCKSR